MNKPIKSDEGKLELICGGLFVTYIALLLLSFTL